MELLDQVFYGHSVFDWGIALAITAGLSIVLYTIQRMMVRHLTQLATKTSAHLDDFIADVLAHTKFIFVLILAAYFGLQYLDLEPKPARLITSAAIIALLLQVAVWGNRAIALWLSRYTARHQDAQSTGVTTLLGFIARPILWAVILLMILDNLGFNITALVAGLGIGGLAVALAVQNILSDIFASLSIAMDKPFIVGDFIIVNEHMGSVEYIGIKTTRIRSLSGEQIIISNADLLGSRIRNYKRMQERRVLFKFGIIYQTPLNKITHIPAMVRNIIESQDKIRFDRAHFKEYGDSSLNFEAVYYVLDPDYTQYMNIQQTINLELFKRFQQEGIEFAYPTQTLFINQAPPAEPEHS
ncbi:MAG: mechanosensitive ion channel family protein [Gammaproteobacteria bacterium]|nr:mechanosensitive ion channel family protein [Gammaproteobacteria bacterium]